MCENLYKYTYTLMFKIYTDKYNNKYKFIQISWNFNSFLPNSKNFHFLELSEKRITIHVYQIPHKGNHG